MFDDREIGLIRVKQEIKGIPLHGVQLGGVDWEKLAQSFGADGVVVETEQALSNALSAAVKSKRTTVIGVRIDCVRLCGAVQCAARAVNPAARMP